MRKKCRSVVSRYTLINGSENAMLAFQSRSIVSLGSITKVVITLLCTRPQIQPAHVLSLAASSSPGA